MKSFTSLLLASAVSASYGGYGMNNDGNLAPGGTTGHYGNDYGHGGHDNHSHQDHIYGYDSIAADYDIDETFNSDLRDALIAAIDLAEADRLSYLMEVHMRREVRLGQVKMMNEGKIRAPFNYQIELLNEEQADIRTASNEALKDTNDAFDDMIFRLEQLETDIIDEQENETAVLIRTI